MPLYGTIPFLLAVNDGGAAGVLCVCTICAW